MRKRFLLLTMSVTALLVACVISEIVLCGAVKGKEYENQILSGDPSILNGLRIRTWTANDERSGILTADRMYGKPSHGQYHIYHEWVFSAMDKGLLEICEPREVSRVGGYQDSFTISQAEMDENAIKEKMHECMDFFPLQFQVPTGEDGVIAFDYWENIFGTEVDSESMSAVEDSMLREIRDLFRIPVNPEIDIPAEVYMDDPDYCSVILTDPVPIAIMSAPYKGQTLLWCSAYCDEETLARWKANYPCLASILSRVYLVEMNVEMNEDGIYGLKSYKCSEEMVLPDEMYITDVKNSDDTSWLLICGQGKAICINGNQQIELPLAYSSSNELCQSIITDGGIIYIFRDGTCIYIEDGEIVMQSQITEGEFLLDEHVHSAAYQDGKLAIATLINPSRDGIYPTECIDIQAFDSTGRNCRLFSVNNRTKGIDIEQYFNVFKRLEISW